MSKKVLGISSSGRVSGNSNQLLQSFLKGATQAGHTTEIIQLTGKKINFCTGCWQCKKTNQCIFRDDMDDIAPKIMAADVIVLASPIYFYAISGQLKTMLDRLDPYYEQINNKDFYYCFSCADNDPSAMDTAVLEIRGFLECCNDCNEKGIIRGTNVTQIGDIKNTPHLEEAFIMGNNI